PKTLLTDTISSLASLAPTYAAIIEKLATNTQLLEKQKNTAFQKFKRTLRRAFNLQEPPVVYDLILIDEKSQARTTRQTDIHAFIANIERKSRMFAVLSNRNSPEYKKITNAQDDAVLQFASKQISDNQDTLQLLTAADEYFKSSISSKERTHIKGLKIDLVTVKNAIIRANQKRAEYCSYIEEMEQMKKLGIMNEE
ncbi:MAG: hypothetical protein K2H09_04795, partial [Treponemataceae bacterium]|nr:hypothetical protein [Treponemataceae bacterium]